MAGYYGAPAHLKRLHEPATTAQERCDAVQAAFRAKPERRSIRREPPPLPKALTPTDNELSLRLAEEIEYVRRMLEGMGDQLSADAAVLMRHGVSLQTIDIAGQILGHVAGIVRSSDTEAAVDQIGMCELKGRLKRQKIA